MTIVTVLYIPEGIILGSDTQATIFKMQKDSSGKEIFSPVNAYINAQKIFDISPKKYDIRFALSQFGIAKPGKKPLSTHVFTIRELLNKKDKSELLLVEKVVDYIISYFSKFEHKDVNRLGFYLCGFDIEDENFVPCVFLIYFYIDNEGKFQIKKDLVSKPKIETDYTVSWSGEGSWIITKLLNLADPAQNIPKAEIPYHLLSLKDGVEFTEYLINTVIGFERFQSKFPKCGGKVNLAVLTPREFLFLNRKKDDLFI
ncbi:hypothetical protein LCGC14_1402170 [marine sediment metagenome]|uniref:Uncharacterized protein n=1 Tax=marine sediment metagenome TaxID=412755 RepID=A0A0F9MC87_9ZZZZ